MRSKSLSHHVAVNAFLIHHDRFLLLKRINPPIIWGPPGGKLHKNEDPLAGLRREVSEEAGLTIQIHQPVTTWFGRFRSLPLLSVDYLCTTDHGEVTLSDEHDQYRWLRIEELQTDVGVYLNSTYGFQLSDFYLAWCTYLLNQKRLTELGSYITYL
jgi:8-oxo-dGTP diphosphatase